MHSPTDPSNPRLALGMTSLVLGLIALFLFFLPILGIPISLFGLGCGVVGFVVAFFAGGASLRWSLGGSVVCGLALGTNLALYYAPEGYLAAPPAPRRFYPLPGRVYVPPPASGLDSGRDPENSRAAQPAVARPVALGVYCTTWEEEGSRTRRSGRLPGQRGTAAGEVVPVHAARVTFRTDQRV